MIVMNWWVSIFWNVNTFTRDPKQHSQTLSKIVKLAKNLQHCLNCQKFVKVVKKSKPNSLFFARHRWLCESWVCRSTGVCCQVCDMSIFMHHQHVYAELLWQWWWSSSRYVTWAFSCTTSRFVVKYCDSDPHTGFDDLGSHGPDDVHHRGLDDQWQSKLWCSK